MQDVEVLAAQHTNLIRSASDVSSACLPNREHPYLLQVGVNLDDPGGVPPERPLLDDKEPGGLRRRGRRHDRRGVHVPRQDIAR